MTMLTAENASALRCLEDHGYTVAWSERGFVECLLSYGAERWLGVGIDRNAAFAHALGLALPSEIARQSFARLSFARASADRDDRGADATDESLDRGGATTEDDSASATSPAVTGGTEREASAHSTPIVNASAGNDAPSAGSESNGDSAASSAPTFASDRSDAPSAAEPTSLADAEPPRPPAATLPALSFAEAMVRLSALEQSICSTRDEVAAWSPVRQRLAIAVWTCQGRAVVEASSHRDVHHTMGKIVPHLKELSERLWPGNVEVLKLEATPRDVVSTLQRDAPPEAEPPRSWYEAAQWAERRLAECELDAAGPGDDDDGWCDARALVPGPANPDRLLESLVAEITEVSGPLDSKPGFEFVSMLRTRAAQDSEQRRWVGFARRARWLRSSVVDTWTWGRAIGRVRFVASNLSKQPAWRPLGNILDPEFAPAKSWAIELGFDPEREARERRTERILGSIPAADADDRTWTDWLARALDDPDIAIERIAASVPLTTRTRIGSIDPAPGDHERGRRFRRRLAKLRAHFADAAAPGEPSRRTAAPSAELAAPPTGQQVAADRPAWIRDVVARIRGKRVLLVCNRADPAVDRTLESLLEVGEYERIEDSMRRVQAARDRIRDGRYDVVLSATGFQSHTVDDQLAEATRLAGIPYVRVNRARPIAVLRALARDFGLLDSLHGSHGRVDSATR